MQNYSSHKNQRGMGLVEIIIGSSIITVGLLALITTYNTYVKYALNNEKLVQATYLLEEGLEAMSLIRDDGWTSKIAALTSGTTYYLSFNGTDWVMTTTPVPYVDGVFLRTVTLTDVQRNTLTQKIVESGGTADSGTKKVTVSVAFPQNAGTTTQSISKYLTNIYAN